MKHLRISGNRLLPVIVIFGVVGLVVILVKVQSDSHKNSSTNFTFQQQNDSAGSDPNSGLNTEPNQPRNTATTPAQPSETQNNTAPTPASPPTPAPTPVPAPTPTPTPEPTQPCGTCGGYRKVNDLQPNHIACPQYCLR